MQVIVIVGDESAASARDLAAAATAGFAPYVDTSLFPPFSLTSVAASTGVRQFNLAFVVSGGGCTPEWGGSTGIGDNPVAAEISALRAMGGDVRVSFGGEDGSELAQTCTSVSQLAAAYQQVISAYDLNKIDFDIEGAALDDTTANAVRDQALAQLQAQDPGLQVSFTLPVEPSGLTQDGIDLLDGAVSAGVSISAVNVMAMDYQQGGSYDQKAIDAANATFNQLKAIYPTKTTAQLWRMVGVTPMLGQNDDGGIFSLNGARNLVTFAKTNHVGELAFWEVTRDRNACNGALYMCTNVTQQPYDFSKIFAGYTG